MMTDLSATEHAMNELFALPDQYYGRLRYTLEDEPGRYPQARETDTQLLRHLQRLLPDITENSREVGMMLAKYVTHFKTLEGVEAVHKALTSAFPTGEIFRMVDMRASMLMTQHEEDWIATFGHHPLVIERVQISPEPAPKTTRPGPHIA